jgi:hypothetical protein
MLERRKSPRKKMILPVKVSIDQNTHLAHTVDITGAGARVGGLRTQLQPGMVVDLQRGSRKAKFRIMWFQQLGANEAQIGIECLEPQDKFWGVDLSEQDRETKKDMDALMSLLSASPKPAQ